MDDAVARTRAFFPRGLYQPPGSFRFSADALLLAAFVARRCLLGGDAGPDRATLLDLGCGCGVVGLACLLAAPRLAASGVDVRPELVEAARRNAAALGLTERFVVYRADLAEPGPFPPPAGSVPHAGKGYTAVAANMPFREAGRGRLPRDPARRAALFADETVTGVFLRAAGNALAEEGSCALVYPLARLDALLGALTAYGFSAVTILPVLTGTASGSRCLVRAVRVARAGMSEARVPCHASPLPPLVLRDTQGGPYTEEATAFCPWLACMPWRADLG